MAIENLAVKNQTSTNVDSANKQADVNRVSNVLVNNTSGTPVIETSAPESTVTTSRNLTMAEIDSKLSKIASKSKLSLGELKAILKSGGYSDEQLSELNNTKFEQLCIVIQIALKSITDKDGKLNKTDFPMALMFAGLALNNKNINNNPEKVVDYVRNNLNKDLLDFIQEYEPSLKGVDIKNISAQQLKEIFKAAIQKLLLSKEKKDPQKIMGFFMAALSKCEPDEKAKIFHAFALLLKDKDMQDKIPDAYKNVLGSFGNDIKRLNEFITKVGPEILRELGFDEVTIKILNFEAINDLSVEQIQGIIKNVLEALDQIDENDLPILRKVLTSINNDSINELTPEELKVLEKYGPLLNQTISIVAAAANRPDLKEKLMEHYKPLLDLLNKIGLSEQIFIGVNNLYNLSPESFNGLSKDNLIKKFNELTNNKFSEAIGDTNPENLYKGETGVNSSDFGMPQRTSQENYWTALARQNDLSQSLYIQNKSDKPEFMILKDTEKSDNKSPFITPWQKYNTIKNLSVKDLHEGLKSKRINIDVVLDNYQDLSSGAKMFVNKLIEIMSPAEQNFRLDGMPSSAAVDIIKHSKINPEDLDLALDYANRKALEKFEEQKQSV